MAKGSKSEKLADEQPPSVEEDLYQILGVESTATPEAIKTAYKKNALRHHPDKVSEDAREEANAKFQKIALAYAVLSDQRRRNMYDRTGNTEEVLGEDGDFDWLDFYREQLSAMLDTRAVSDFQKKYQGSDEEKKDILEAYEKNEGDMDGIYESVMLSNVLDDDERFRAIIDEAIAAEEVEKYTQYTEESEEKREKRIKLAKKEAKEAEKMSKKLENDKKKKAAKASKGSTGNEDDLLALISKRQQQRGQGFLAHLEEKYAQPNGKGKKRGPPDEPSEEAFAAVAARKTKDTKPKSKKSKA